MSNGINILPARTTDYSPPGMGPAGAANTAVEAYFAPPDVHDEARERAVGQSAAFIFALVLLVAHGLNAYFFIAGDSAPAAALIVHLLLVVATGFLARMMILSGMDARFLMVLLVGTAALGIFGAAGAAIAVLLNGLYVRVSQPFHEWFASIFPHDEQTTPERVYDDIITGRDETAKAYSVIPFMEVMAVGNDLQKRDALSKMMMRFDPRFAPAMRRALSDRSNTVRVAAATAITRIESQFHERLLKLTELYQRLPKDPVVVRALASHCDDYAFIGLLDPERERENREMALNYYLEYLKLAPRDEAVRTHVGRLLLRGGEPARAADWFRDCLRDGFRSDTLTMWYIEALYTAGRYADLRALATQGVGFADTLRNANPALADSLLLWTGRFVPNSMSRQGGLS